ncbi:MAG: right-handed parallel beta-helix repeat-containing protein, partial [Caldilineaceae bacterium]
MFRVPRTAPKRRLLLLIMAMLQVAAMLAPLLPATASRALAQEPLPEDPLDQGPWMPPPAPADPSMPLISVENPADESVRPAETNAGFSININTLSDEWSTDANKATSKCSLREALQATVTGNPNGNQGCGAASIGNFAAYDFKFLPGTYLLTRPEDLPDIGGNKKITMDGKGAVTIDGGAKQGRKLGIFQVFDAELYLIKMTLQNAERNVGSAIELAGGGAYVQVTEVTFKRNFAALYGGAVSVATGDFVCIKSKFTENTARERGGALASGNGTTVIDRCDFFKNHTEGKGGAISVTGGTNQGDFFTFVDGESGLYVRDAKLYENWVRPLTPIQNPKDDASGGGAVHVDGGGHVVIERSQIYDNYTANSRGGGAIISSGVLVLLDVAISRNEARLQGVSKTFGGAILFDPSDGRLSRVSIHHNKARFAGGIYARPGTNIFIANATVSNNDADFSTGIALGSPAYGTGQDGGESGGQIRLYHSTVARNDNKFGDIENIDSFGNSSTIVLA